MKTTFGPFESEEIGLGTCMAQGFAGGLLVGFALMLLVLICRPNPDNFLVVLYAVFPMLICGSVGAVKAIAFWGLNRFLGSPLSALARIVAGGFMPTVLWVSLVLREVPADQHLLVGASCVFLLSMPTSLLIGSQIVPWEFFTFGSIVVRENGKYKRCSATDAPVTVGALPLRLLSTGGLLFWLLVVAAVWPNLGRNIQRHVVFAYFPILYLALSACLTFRSPRKSVLFISGLILNLPLGVQLYFDYSTPGTSTGLAIVCTIFMAAWTAFFGSQLTVSSQKDLMADIQRVNPTSPVKRNLDHQCLGSRFAEWQQRAA